ncbi:MAG: tetratricopeptide repeat protein [Candidatus Muiribacteriota bacterium]
MDIVAFLLIILIVIIIFLLKRFYDSFSKETHMRPVENMIKKKDFMGAVKYLEDLKQHEPDNPEIYCYLAPLYENKKMYVRAVKCYKKLIDLNHPENEHNLLVISQKLKNIFEKMELKDQKYIENKKILEIDPSNQEALFEIGYFLCATGNYNQAIDTFEKLVKINPDHIQGWFYLGITYLSKKWLKEGKNCMNKVIAKDSGNGYAYFFLGFTEKEYKKPEAIKTFEEALEILQDEEYKIKSVIAAAVTSIEQNLIDMAVNILNKELAQLDMDNPLRKDFLYNLGWAYFFKGDIEASISNWEEVFSIDMNYENISEILNSEVNSNFEEMERIYSIYASNISYPTAREFTGFSKEYDIDKLEQEYNLWKQKLIDNAKKRGVYIGPVKSAKVFATLSKMKFKNIAYKIVTSLGNVVEKEEIYPEGVDFVTYKRNAGKSDKIFFRIRKWTDIITEEKITKMHKDLKDSKTKYKIKYLMCCGKFTKKAKEFAEKYNIKIYDARILTNILSKIASREM